jgi:hypothetical protein
MACPTKRAGCVVLRWSCCDQFQVVRRHPSSFTRNRYINTDPHTNTYMTTGLRFPSHHTCRSSSTPRTKHRLHSTVDDRLQRARKSFWSVSPFFSLSLSLSLFFYALNVRSLTRLIPAFLSFIQPSSQQPEPAQPLLHRPQPAVTKLEPDSVSGAVGAGRSHRGDDGLIKPKREKRPVSISGFKSSSPSVTASSPLRPPGKKPTLPASSLIYQDADVGLDLGSARRAARDGRGFIKPADVDAPPRDSQPSGGSVLLPEAESAPVKAGQRKRSIDGSGGSTQFTDDAEDRSQKKRKR